MEKDLVIAVDIGGTQFRVALCDPDGRVVARASAHTRAVEGKQAVIQRIFDLIKQITSGQEHSIRAVGVAAPGPLNPWTGVIFRPPNLQDWTDVPLKNIFEEEFARPVLVGNDANLAALGEHIYGAGKGKRNLVYITVSTGIGGGVIEADRLILGARGLAGEIGHMTIDPIGPPCQCGNMGCLEALASGPAIAREAVRLIRQGMPSMLVSLAHDDLTQIDGQLVVEAARAGDQLSSQVFSRAAFYLGIGVVNVLHLFNPEIVIIGGGVSNAGDILFGPVRELVSQRTMEAVRRGVSIVPAALGDDAGLLGAAALARSGDPSGAQRT